MTIQSTYDFSGASGNAGGPFSAVAGIGIQQTGSGKGQGSNDTTVASEDSTILLPDQYAQITVNSGLSGAGGNINLDVRRSSGNGYRGQWNAFDGQLKFYRVDSGAETAIRTPITLVVANNDVLKAWITGNVLSLYRNGVLVGSSDPDSTYTGGGKTALYCYQWGADTPLLMDDWEAGDYPSLAVPQRTINAKSSTFFSMRGR